MIILGIETSCDETALSIIEATETDDDRFKIEIKANSVMTQIAIHQQYGGVFPILAKREHQKNLIPLFKKTIEESNFSESGTRNQELGIETKNQLLKILSREPELLEQFLQYIPTISKPEIDAIAVTRGPGLEPALWVGVNFAQALSAFWNIPLIPINHMEGHILISLLTPNEKFSTDQLSISRQNQSQISSYNLNPIPFPSLALLVSGGHTELILIKDLFEYVKIGVTRDDAVGEAFDKVARILGLPYPGGPEISKLADVWRKSGKTGTGIKFPRPMINSGDLNFSFSGLKTSVLYTVQKIGNLTQDIKEEVACEFENAVVDTIVKKTRRAITQYSARTLIIGGGVAANKNLRENLQKLCLEENCPFFVPEIGHSTDNALMIAIAGACRLIKKFNPSPINIISADGNWSIDKI